MATLADLATIIGPPIKAPPAIDWMGLERALGLSFPDDYKQLTGTYPELKFDDFLGLAHPGMPPSADEQLAELNKALDPLRARMSARDEIAMIDGSFRRSYVKPFPIYPDPGGLLQWGSTDNGDRCMWLTSPDWRDWTIVIENGLWWHYDGGLLDFLVGVMNATIDCPIFPETFPSSREVRQF